MKTQWLVAKYMPDAVRREPINVGVVLFSHGRIISRFRGQKEDGTINGHAVKGWAKDLANYRSWVASWNYFFSKGWDVPRLTRRSGDQNYFLEFSGERIVGDGNTDPATTLEQLYCMLVESEPDDAVSVSDLSETIFKKLNIYERVVQDYKFSIPAEGGGDALFDEVFFDYKFDNSAPNLFKEIALSFGDARTWNVVHAAAWSFQKTREYASKSAHQHPRTIALVKPRERDDKDLVSQMGVLAKHAEVVDVSRVDAAANKLARLLHV